MRDEFKLRLPMIIDGTFFLQFTLIEIECGDDNESHSGTFRVAAESSIPLSSSSVRDSTGGLKVATVLPM